MDIEGASGLAREKSIGKFPIILNIPAGNFRPSPRRSDHFRSQTLREPRANSRRLKFGLIEEFAFLCTEKLPRPVNLLNCGIFHTKMDLTFDSHRTTLKPRIL